MAVVGRNHAALSTPALEIPDPTAEDVVALADRMFATCLVKRGLGLAAPQVGVSLRLIVMYDGGVVINPQLTVGGELLDEPEACISLPGRAYTVPRSTEAEVKFIDLSGKEQSQELEPFTARLMQHEVDHLDGLLVSRFPELIRGASFVASL